MNGELNRRDYRTDDAKLSPQNKTKQQRKTWNPYEDFHPPQQHIKHKKPCRN